MKIFHILLAVLAVSCAPMPRQTVYLDQHPERPPEICDAVTAAINQQDWATLRLFTRPGMMANDYITSLEHSGHPIRVGKLIGAETVVEMGGQPQVMYSFALENKDGTAAAHSLRIKVRDNRGQPEIVDFWETGA